MADLLYTKLIDCIKNAEKTTSGDIFEILLDNEFFRSCYVWGSDSDTDDIDTNFDNFCQYTKKYEHAKKITLNIRRDLQGGNIEKTYIIKKQNNLLVVLHITYMHIYKIHE